MNTYEFDTDAEFFTAVVLHAYRRGELDGSRAAYDTQAFIGELEISDWSDLPDVAYGCCNAGEACSSPECTGTPCECTGSVGYHNPFSATLEEKVDEALFRIGLIEKHFVGTEYRATETI